MFLGISLQPLAFFFPNWLGAFAVGNLLPILTLGPLPPGGVLTVSVATPVLPGVEVIQFYEQAVFVGTQLILSAPSFPILLDPSL